MAKRNYTLDEMSFLIENQSQKISELEVKIDKLLDNLCDERKLLAKLKSSLTEYLRKNKAQGKEGI